MPTLRPVPKLSIAAVAGMLLGLTGCEAEPPARLPDDPGPYLEDVDFRRTILERDLLDQDNVYARRRLESYALEGTGWEALPERDPISRPLTDDDRARLEAGLPLELDEADGTTLVPDSLPANSWEWELLGQRVIAEYPLRVDSTYEELAAIPGGLEESGFLRRPDGGWVGLRVFRDGDGDVRVGPTCGQCHCSYNDWGELRPTVGNKAMDIGRAELLTMGLDPDEEPPEGLPPRITQLYELGPGRVDVLPDGLANPFAIPDLGGLVSLPYLQANANWYHREPTTLAIRCETLFITSNSERSRIPRSLAWAIAAWIRAQDFPEPLDAEPGPDADAGEQVFADAGCAACHTPPDYTSDRLVEIDEVGTDPAAPSSPVRHTGYIRIPSLRGVGRTGPWLHDGTVPTLEQMFDPARPQPGHTFGQDLSESQRQELVSFLRSL